ncbi:hypothetical protein [Wolbachia endosymbiont (group B) of Xanthorhoe designata]|uniref:hypothetical protein n=1 Tax=Wolbachia endosymbiont (group B) of Xanthorhoe designata TaxID=3066184 RepID=UPI00333F8196
MKYLQIIPDSLKENTHYTIRSGFLFNILDPINQNFEMSGDKFKELEHRIARLENYVKHQFSSSTEDFAFSEEFGLF